jgi:hypothetical protein
MKDGVSDDTLRFRHHETGCKDCRKFAETQLKIDSSKIGGDDMRVGFKRPRTGEEIGDNASGRVSIK